ncbi:venom acid phosphatase Acph-1-like isoform X1 [Colias croceus]|uniref:venom acid phosphatase Acph-1-like isoform X1 n=1 Tax=Colias crocea TaxID=72248 RepID=UPI001E27A99A|nr:venom acid phosphatase Acph-1-like isoform X1 [Colias croceus]
MKLVVLLTILYIGICSCHNSHKPSRPDRDDALTKYDMVMAFAVFRHGDRTPDHEELNKYPNFKLEKDIFFPFGKKALTNRGKERAYRVGQYLRNRYDGLISKLYLPEEVHVQTTDYARTKMSVLVALSALYPPQAMQRWNPRLNWQPIPYDTPQRDNDSLLHFLNCPGYSQLKIQLYDLPEVQSYMQASKGFFKTLTEESGYNFTTPEEVFMLDNLFQALNNVDVPTPQWAQKIMHQIKETTKLEYSVMYYTDELKRIAVGGILTDVVEATKAKIAGDNNQPKLFLYSAHEDNVASILSACKAFVPHQPKYGSTVSLELWRNRETGKYGFMVVYAPEIGGRPQALPVAGCGGGMICDYDTFLDITKDYLLPHSEYKQHCTIA